MTDHRNPDNAQPLDLRPLPGSERGPARGVVPATTELPATGEIEATVVLRRRAAIDPAAVLSGAPMTKQDLAETSGCEPG